jgi:transcription termination factor Rho
MQWRRRVPDEFFPCPRQRIGVSPVADDAAHFERSTLARKDRTELAAIAEALGRKPGSRAKKAEIVDLILELTGVTPAESVDSTVGGTVGGTVGSAPTTDAPELFDAVGEPAPAGQPADAVAVDANGSEAASSESSPEVLDASPAHDADGAGAETAEIPGGDDTEPTAVPSPEGARAGRTRAEREPRAPGRGTPAPSAPPQVEGNDGTTNPEGGDAADPDGTGRNRRRRRRGRDRDDVVSAPAASVGDDEPLTVAGLLDLRDDGYGFLRVSSFAPTRDDVYVSVKQCRQFGLRRGDHVTGAARAPGHKEKNPALVRIDAVNGTDPESSRSRPRFEELTAVHPSRRVTLANPARQEPTGRIIDLLAPLGLGQRAVIAAPPRAGRTTVVRSIAASIEALHPDLHLVVLLVDERPEEVTDFRRGLTTGEVVASTVDRPAEEHVGVAELTLEHAKRLVEYGNDVVLIVDGLSRLARAYQHVVASLGRSTLYASEVAAVQLAKRYFGAARAVEEGGSLTIVAATVSETGAALDSALVDELSAIANSELHLSGSAARLGIHPAIDVRSGATRHAELLREERDGERAGAVARRLDDLAQQQGEVAALMWFLDALARSGDDDALAAGLASEPT